MIKIFVLMVTLLLVTMFCGSVLAGPVSYSGDRIANISGMGNQPQNGDSDEESPGPAPDSGDGIPDGSGMDKPSQNGDPDGGRGPAPNSGDGIPDGSGF